MPTIVHPGRNLQYSKTNHQVFCRTGWARSFAISPVPLNQSRKKPIGVTSQSAPTGLYILLFPFSSKAILVERKCSYNHNNFKKKCPYPRYDKQEKKINSIKKYRMMQLPSLDFFAQILHIYLVFHCQSPSLIPSRVANVVFQIQGI